ncbi:MAG: FAD-binding oxidoreductase [Candidatus Saccharibacteria bacterium]|nr:FAD-binding oxidoreductase [Candidatus Saccharibacteria bacterium]
MGKIVKCLNQLTVGNIFDSPEVLDAHATDCSALTIRPKFVAVPESTSDVQRIMRFCHQLAVKNLKIPVTIRGSGLREGGAALGNGLVISMSKMSRLLEADQHERLVRVEAGITLKELNTALSMYGLTIPISGFENDTIGGLISSFVVDELSGKYGGIQKYVEKIEAVLTNGEVIQTERLRPHKYNRIVSANTVESKIYQKISQIYNSNRAIVNNISQEKHNLAGYPGIAGVFSGGTIDLAPLFLGSEGTLGVITEVILKAIPIKFKSGRAVAAFEDFEMANNFLKKLVSLNPRKLNLYDARIIRIAADTGKRLSPIMEKIENGYVVYACFDEKIKLRLKEVGIAFESLGKRGQLFIDSDKNKVLLDEFENSLISFLNQTRNGERVPILTDFYIPPDNLGGFISDLKVLERNLGMKLAPYGSYATSNYNLRPKLDVTEPDFNKKVTALLRAGDFVIRRRGGNLAGGTSEGRLKALITNNLMDENRKKIYLQIKTTFDDLEILNPNVKLGATPNVNLRHFRTTNSAKVVL